MSENDKKCWQCHMKDESNANAAQQVTAGDEKLLTLIAALRTHSREPS